MYAYFLKQEAISVSALLVSLGIIVKLILTNVYRIHVIMELRVKIKSMASIVFALKVIQVCYLVCGL